MQLVGTTIQEAVGSGLDSGQWEWSPENLVSASAKDGYLTGLSDKPTFPRPNHREERLKNSRGGRVV